METTKTENRISKIVNDLLKKNDFEISGKENELRICLSMIVTLSIDNNLKELNNLIQISFPEYGK
jgi:hypothetical protein